MNNTPQKGRGIAYQRISFLGLIGMAGYATRGCTAVHYERLADCHYAGFACVGVGVLLAARR